MVSCSHLIYEPIKESKKIQNETTQHNTAQQLSMGRYFHALVGFPFFVSKWKLKIREAQQFFQGHTTCSLAELVPELRFQDLLVTFQG